MKITTTMVTMKNMGMMGIILHIIISITKDTRGLLDIFD